ncbi:PDZ domain-containing protein [Aeromonas salmonicida]|uniref:PDZ domain-containing protein n=1 Tax=Aeromonas salmonicida TaxID=645 RepID=UPI001F588C7E|nr:PDZ domain-containing protein [Aeromonas salmonicida]
MPDNTASLGGYWQDGKTGVELVALLAGGPLEQETDLTPGARLLAINGTEVPDLNALDAQLNHQADQRLALTLLPRGARRRCSSTSPPWICSRSTSCNWMAGSPSAVPGWRS